MLQAVLVRTGKNIIIPISLHILFSSIANSKNDLPLPIVFIEYQFNFLDIFSVFSYKIVNNFFDRFNCFVINGLNLPTWWNSVVCSLFFLRNAYTQYIVL